MEFGYNRQMTGEIGMYEQSHESKDFEFLVEIDESQNRSSNRFAKAGDKENERGQTSLRNSERHDIPPSYRNPFEIQDSKALKDVNRQYLEGLGRRK